VSMRRCLLNRMSVSTLLEILAPIVLAAGADVLRSAVFQPFLRF